MRNHVTPAFGHLPLAGITKLRVQAWVRELHGNGLAPATVRECHRLLQGVLSEAVDAPPIPESPCRNISLPRIPHQEQRYLAPDRVERLTEVIDPAFRALVYSAVYLGCRCGELVGLKKDNLNLLKREVRVVGSLEEVNDGPRYVEETKMSASRRTLSIPPFLAEELGLHQLRAPDSDFVFTGAKGALLRRSNVRKRYWKPAVNWGSLIRRFVSMISGTAVPRSSSHAVPTPRRFRRVSATPPSRPRSTATGICSRASDRNSTRAWRWLSGKRARLVRVS